MKSLKYILTIFAVLLVHTAMGQDYLKIHFSDGHSERHFLSLVKEISTTKYDINGFYHQDYQTQQVIMLDTVYSYPLSSIDSITYHKVDVETVNENYDMVVKTVSSVLSQNRSADEIETHFDEIKKCIAVDSIWRTGNMITVQVKDGPRIYYIEKGLMTENDRSLMPVKSASVHAPNAKNTGRQITVNKDVKIAIANQTYNDESLLLQHSFLDAIEEEFANLGFSVKSIHDVNLDFYTSEMSKYNLVFLVTHGGFDGEKHSIATSDLVEKTEVQTNEITIYQDWSDIQKMYQADIDDIHIGHIFEDRDETEYLMGYVFLSEDYLRKKTRNFAESPLNIFYNVACKSLMGDGILRQESEGIDVSGDDKFATIMHNKNIDVYLGYNMTDHRGVESGASFFLNLLRGNSVGKSFKLLRPEYKHETDEPYAYLLDIPKNPSDRNKFITKTFTEPVDEDMDINGQKITLKGITTLSLIFDYESGDLETYIQSGFRYGMDPSMTVYTQTEDRGFEEIDSEKGNQFFTAQIPVENDETLYYQAFTFDGSCYNLGDIQSFTPKPAIAINPMSLEFGEVTVNSTRTKEITVTNTGNASLNYLIQADTIDYPFSVPDAWKAFSLSPGSSKTHIVRFTPYCEGGAVYDFEVISNACNNGQQTISLRGTGVGAPVLPDNAVDLGLPSGTLWAKCNLGAELAYATGDKYAWGEPYTKSEFTWKTYKWAKGSNNTLTKYNSDPDRGTVDNKLYLDVEDDAAHVVWGGNWYTPTEDELLELLTCCTWTWHSIGGINGYKVTSNNAECAGKFIFLPAGGYAEGKSVFDVNNGGNYWTSSRYYDKSGLHFTADEIKTSNYNRYYGFSIRPVYRIYLKDFTLDRSELSLDRGGEYTFSVTYTPGNATTRQLIWKSSDPTVASVDSKGKVKALWQGTAVITAQTNDGKLIRQCVVTVNQVLYPVPEAVDLGLSVKWASFNLGAAIPTDRGDYFAWGETEGKYSGKNNFAWDTYKYSYNGSSSKRSKYNDEDGCYYLSASDDAASVYLGGDWRMPTAKEVSELINNCKCEPVTLDGVHGYRITGLNGNSIFLPTTGSYDYSLHDYTYYGHYWTSQRYDSREAYELRISYDDNFDRSYIKIYSGILPLGLAIRPVFAKRVVEKLNISDERLVISQGHTKELTVSGWPYLYDEVAVQWESEDTNVAIVKDGKVMAVGVGKTTVRAILSADHQISCECVIVVPDTRGHEFVDFNLPSGTLWATCNIGATSPEQYGDYFAWGEIEPKNDYSWDTYKFYKDGKTTKYLGRSSEKLEDEDDAAVMNWNGVWRMPTNSDFKELRNFCKYHEETINGIKGMLFQREEDGPTLFIPYAGQHYDTSTIDVGQIGFLWTSETPGARSNLARFFYIEDSSTGLYEGDRNVGISVRPVCVPE